jgi:hypothetical protein
MVQVLKRKGELKVNASQVTDLIKLGPCRNKGGRKSQSTTKTGNLLKNLIPISTFADWQEGKPGFLEIDLVAHCGETVEKFYLNTF